MSASGFVYFDAVLDNSRRQICRVPANPVRLHVEERHHRIAIDGRVEARQAFRRSIVRKDDRLHAIE